MLRSARALARSVEPDSHFALRILGQARITVTLDVYTHLFDVARHAREIRTLMTASPFAELLDSKTDPACRVLRLR